MKFTKTLAFLAVVLVVSGLVWKLGSAGLSGTKTYGITDIQSAHSASVTAKAEAAPSIADQAVASSEAPKAEVVADATPAASEAKSEAKPAEAASGADCSATCPTCPAGFVSVDRALLNDEMKAKYANAPKAPELMAGLEAAPAAAEPAPAVEVKAVTAKAGDTVYATATKDVFLSDSETKSAGRLMPTTGVEISEVIGDKVKFKVKGFQNPDAPSMIYFADGKRIMSISFAKTAKPEIKVTKAGEGGGWNEVEFEGYTANDGFSDDIGAIMAKAKQQHEEGCGICHRLHAANSHKADQWPAMFRSMASRTAIPKDEHWNVIGYLQKHSSDFNMDQ